MKVRRNKSWLQSVLLGLENIILWAPTTLLGVVHDPVAHIIGHTGAILFEIIGLAGRLIFFIGTSAVLLALGFAGLLSRQEPQVKS